MDCYTSDVDNALFQIQKEVVFYVLSVLVMRQLTAPRMLTKHYLMEWTADVNNVLFQLCFVMC
jgi:hypothetical protein